MSDPTPVIDDLREESEELDALVARLSPEQWTLTTPGARLDDRPPDRAPGLDRPRRPGRRHRRGRLPGTGRAGAGRPRPVRRRRRREGARRAPAELLAAWREGRAALDKALRESDPGARFPGSARPWPPPPRPPPA
ncbi:hypothetical protein LV779_30035 [Streptomyces thinghirensis]|nr:hypothetical protein [Streptomyces thinghirensis]